MKYKVNYHLHHKKAGNIGNFNEVIDADCKNDARNICLAKLRNKYDAAWTIHIGRAELI